MKNVRTNRSHTWQVKRDSRVCSNHFVDGKPTKENPYPTLNMGPNENVRIVKGRKPPKRRFNSCNVNIPSTDFAEQKKTKSENSLVTLKNVPSEKSAFEKRIGNSSVQPVVTHQATAMMEKKNFKKYENLQVALKFQKIAALGSEVQNSHVQSSPQKNDKNAEVAKKRTNSNIVSNVSILPAKRRRTLQECGNLNADDIAVISHGHNFRIPDHDYLPYCETCAYKQAEISKLKQQVQALKGQLAVYQTELSSLKFKHFNLLHKYCQSTGIELNIL